MIKVLHNNSCSKSIGILEYLDENGVPFEVIDIINNPLSETELKTVLKKLDMKPSEILRKTDDLFRNDYGDKVLSEDEIFNILLNNQQLIQRPILIKEGVAMVGRPIENVKFFIHDY